MGISMDVHPTWRGWIVVDAFFACVFLSDILTKLFTLRCKSLFCGPDVRWNVFEGCLVFLAVLEVIMSLTASKNTIAQSTGMLMLLRILKLARSARILRLARLQLFAGEFVCCVHAATLR
mmetsp:Transcript_43197/g.119472  ORF Transcript_43197/g.119472 Transcript_43197/m.119472 type:complete len:120 (-) Transcript_43197:35-394(-)